MASPQFEERVKKISNLLGSHPDFPIPGIVFCDIFPVLRNPEAFRDLIELMVEHIRSSSPQAEVIVGLESRGFLFGPQIAEKLNIAFVPVRKPGKLPGKVERASYVKEYGEDILEVQTDAIRPGQKVVLVDDLLATGGTLAATVQLMEKVKAEVIESVVVIELPPLEGRKKVKGKVFSFIQRD